MQRRMAPRSERDRDNQSVRGADSVSRVVQEFRRSRLLSLLQRLGHC
jgi:hypothetical protein